MNINQIPYSSNSSFHCGSDVCLAVWVRSISSVSFVCNGGRVAESFFSLGDDLGDVFGDDFGENEPFLLSG